MGLPRGRRTGTWAWVLPGGVLYCLPIPLGASRSQRDCVIELSPASCHRRRKVPRRGRRAPPWRPETMTPSRAAPAAPAGPLPGSPWPSAARARCARCARTPSQAAQQRGRTAMLLCHASWPLAGPKAEWEAAGRGRPEACPERPLFFGRERVLPPWRALRFAQTRTLRRALARDRGEASSGKEKSNRPRLKSAKRRVGRLIVSPGARAGTPSTTTLQWEPRRAATCRDVPPCTAALLLASGPFCSRAPRVARYTQRSVATRTPPLRARADGRKTR